MAPSSLAPTAQTLEVPGARLYYEVRGRGPLVVLVGAPMDAGPFGPLADLLAGDYTVLTTDPRGINRSPVDDPDQDSTPEMRADDLSRLVASVDAGPAVVLGSSGGAVSALALVQAHPEQVRVVVAHEPPLIELLPDRAERHAGSEVVIARWLAGDYAGVVAGVPGERGHPAAAGRLRGGVRRGAGRAGSRGHDVPEHAHAASDVSVAAGYCRLALGRFAGRGWHRRGVRGAGLRPDVAGPGRGAGYRAGDVPRRAYRVRRGSGGVRRPAACRPAGDG